MTPKEFFDFAKKNNAGMVDLKFVDLLGTWQHCTFPMEFLDAKTLEEGLGFDGSSIRGWKPIHQSDMMAVPDLEHRRYGRVFRQTDGQRSCGRRRPDHTRRL